MVKKIPKVAGLLVAAVLLFYVAYTYRKYRVAPELDFSRIEVIDMLGQKTRILKAQERPLIVVFYASWCHDCAREMPKLQQVLAKVEDEAKSLRDEYEHLEKGAAKHPQATSTSRAAGKPVPHRQALRFPCQLIED